jgi:hypothetical protein
VGYDNYAYYYMILFQLSRIFIKQNRYMFRNFSGINFQCSGHIRYRGIESLWEEIFFLFSSVLILGRNKLIRFRFSFILYDF